MNENDSSISIDTALSELLAAVTEVNVHIDNSNQHAEETLQHVETRVDTATNELEDMFSELDVAAADAEEELDTLILSEVESIAEDEV